VKSGTEVNTQKAKFLYIIYCLLIAITYLFKSRSLCFEAKLRFVLG